MIEVASAAVKIVPDMAGFSPALSRGIQTSGTQAAAAATRLGGTLSAAVTLPVAAIGIGAVKAFTDFDSKLTESIAIMGDAGDALRDELAAGARQVAKDTTISASQAAESYFFLASAGLSAEASLASLPRVAKFAQAGMFDMATATDLATDAQSALGLTVRDDAVKNLENLTRVTDVLVKANILANASVEQFATSLTNRAGAGLRLVNKDIEEGVAVLAAFADQGVKGEEAGTRLDIVLRDLQTQALANKDAFREFNIEVFDSQGNMRNIADILEDIEGAFAGASDETKRATLLQLGFSDRSVASLLTLVGLSDQIRIYEAELRKAGGTTDEVAERQLRSLSAQLTIAKNRITDAGLVLGEQFAPTVVAAAEGIAAFAEAFTKLPGPIRQAVVATAALAAIAGPLLLLGGRLAQSIIALRVLTGVQGAAAISAGRLATAELAAAQGITAAGAAAARSAPLLGAAGGAAGAGAAGLLGGAGAGAAGGSLASFGLNTTRGALLGGGAGGLAARLKGGISGASVFKGLGITFATELGAGLIQGIGTQEGAISDVVKDTTANALRFGGLGAAVGTFGGPLGIAIGGGLGLAVGAGVGFFRSSGASEEAAEDVADDLATAFSSAVSDLSGRQAGLVADSIASLVDDAVTSGIEQGLSAEAAGALGDTLEEILVAGVRQGIDPSVMARGIDEATIAAIATGLGTPAQAAFAAARIQALGDGLGEDIGETTGEAVEKAFGGIFDTGRSPVEIAEFRAAEFALAFEDAFNNRPPQLSFGDAFTEAFEGGDSIISSIRSGALAGGGIDLGFVVESIAESVRGVPSIFSDVFGEAKEVSLTAIEELVQAQRTKFEAFESNIRTIAEAGLFALADQIRESGPAAAAEAQAVVDGLVAGSDAPFNIEADLRGLSEGAVEAFQGVFAEAQPDEKVRGFGDLFVDTIGSALDPEAGRRIGSDFVGGIELGFAVRFGQLLNRVQFLTGQIEAVTRRKIEARSPSEVGRRIGQDFVDGINLGIEKSPVSAAGPFGASGDVRNGDGGGSGGGDSFSFTINNPDPRPAPPDVVRALALTRTVGILRGGR